MTARPSQRRSAGPRGRPWANGHGDHRDSHFASAQDADDIFTLYGDGAEEDGHDEGHRNSHSNNNTSPWAHSPHIGVALSPPGPAHYEQPMERLDDHVSSPPDGDDDVFTTPQEYADDSQVTDYMQAARIDYSARGDDRQDWSEPYVPGGDHGHLVAPNNNIGRAFSSYDEAGGFDPSQQASPVPQTWTDTQGRERRPSGHDSVCTSRRPSGNGSISSRRPSGNDSISSRRPSGNDSRRPSGNDSRQPSGGSGGAVGTGTGTIAVSTGTASAVPLHLRAPGTPDRAESLSPPGSSGTSPIHPSIKRIHDTSRNVSGASGASGASVLSGSPAGSSRGASRSSLVSSQYPGEDLDAFHVRSTYARLDVEGVYGDGWDEGVERTRGGMTQQSGRVTMVFPSAEGGLLEQEQKFLSSLDRYGFVDTPAQARSEGRLALVPSAPFGKVPKVRVRSSLGGAKDRKQSTSPPNSEPPGPAHPPTDSPNVSELKKHRSKEEERVSKWLRMMTVAKRDEGHNAIAWRWSSEEGAKHRTRIYKGIPDRWRMAAWWTLAEERAKSGNRVPSHDSLEADYQSRRDQASENDVQIDLDVPRTISGHALFRTRFGHGQRALFHVLHSFSQSCFTCGYCQGMGSVAATLLCYFEPERAYTLMVRLHDQYNMHGIFAPGFPGLLESFYVQERLLEAIMPDVYESFQRNMISSSAWGAKIYITLFVNVVPFNTQLRIWDALWVDGYDVMVIAVLALLWAFRPLLAHKAANFESILSLLSSYYVLEDEDAMLEWMRKLLWQPGVKELIALWRREWKSLADRGKTDGLLL